MNSIRSLLHSFLTGWMLLLCLTPARAQIQVTAQLDRDIIYVRDGALLQVEVMAEAPSVPKPVLPKVDQLAFTEVPGQRTGLQIINGVTRHSQTFVYRVSAYQPGTYEIYPIAGEYGEKRYLAQKLILQVIEQGRAREEAPEYCLKLEADKETAYVNEPILLTYKQYSRWKPTAKMKLDLDVNSFKGFWHEEVPVKDLRVFSEEVGTTPYHVVPLQTIILFPISMGDLAIEPVNLTSVLEKPVDPRQNRRRSIFDFDDFFGMGSSNAVQVNMQSNPLTLKILPLPNEGKPNDFSGAVGQYRMTAAVDKTEVKIGDPVTLRVIVEGRGNLKNLPEPTLPNLEDFEQYESTKHDNIAVQGGTISGSVTFDYLLIPRTEKAAVIGPVMFNYFDTALKQYRVERSEPIQLSVLPSDRPRGDLISIGNGGRRRQIQILGEDLRYIQTNAALALKPSQANRIPIEMAIVLHVVPAGTLLGFFLFLRRQRRKQADPIWARQLQAPRQARKGLRQCESHLQAGSGEAFYGALQRTLNDYFSGRFGVAIAGMTSIERVRLFEQRLQDRNLAEKIEAIYARCDEARFAPGSASREAMNQTLEEARELLRKAAR